MHIAILSPDSPETVYARVRLSDVLRLLQPAISFTWTEAGKEPLHPRDAEVILRDADVVVVQRSFPHPNTMDFMQAILFDTGKPVIYETDDLLTNLPPLHPAFANSEKYRHLMMACIANCDAIITSTVALKDQYTELNPRGYVFGNALDESLWYQPAPYHTAVGSDRTLNIGFCGSSTHVPDLACIEEALERIHTRYRDRVRFSFFGCITDRLKRLPNVVYQEGFLSYAEYPALLRSLQFDIGLAPLEDNIFNSCKSNIKYLEYAACGIPGVYSNVTPYSASVVYGKTGMLPDNSPDAWYDAISSLIENRALANEITVAAHEDVWSRFSMRVNAKDWLSTVEEIVAIHQDNLSAPLGNRTALARSMWEQAVDYERRLAKMDTSLKQIRSELAWLENRPLMRALRAAKSIFSNHD